MLCLRSAGTIIRLIGQSGVEAFARLMGFLLVCLGVQFVINGVLDLIEDFPLVN
ncbi:MAG TPA: MarC family protein [Stenotrophomonas sp.]